MKRTMIGCCLSVVGGFSFTALMITVSAHVSEVGSWSTPPGRAVTAMTEYGMGAAVFLSAAVFLLGFLVLAVEYFRKDQ